MEKKSIGDPEVKITGEMVRAGVNALERETIGGEFIQAYRDDLVREIYSAMSAAKPNSAPRR